MCNTVVLSADCGPQVDRWYAHSQVMNQQSRAVSGMSNYEHYVQTYQGKDWAFDLELHQWFLRDAPASCAIDEVERPGVVRISIGIGTTTEHVRKLYRFLLSWVQEESVSEHQFISDLQRYWPSSFSRRCQRWTTRFAITKSRGCSWTAPLNEDDVKNVH